MMSFLGPVALGVLLAIVLVAVAWSAARKARAAAAEEAERVLDDARRAAESEAQAIRVAAEDRASALEEEWENRERELEGREATVETRARDVSANASKVERELRQLDRRERDIAKSEHRIAEAEREAVARRDEATTALERIAGLTADQARAELVAGIEADARREGARIARKIEDEAREGAERAATRMVVQATQRIGLRDVLDSTVTFVKLPSDEMKGRIIGREGRNIRAIENATGIDLIVDDTPQAILISSFDPIRREIARVAIERLVEDGRIHPARIEEVVERVRAETDTLIEDAGTQAAFALEMSDLHPKILRRVGRMRFRTHHGTNLLQHCQEVALLAGRMAEEVGARVEIVHRAGLFHEIGRVDDSVTGHTALASADLAGKFGENDEVVHAIQALHPEVEAKSTEALLLEVANRIAENRPGARKDNVEIFVERLTRLEAIAMRQEAVTAAYAVKAGKEVRVVVDSKIADDGRAHALSKEIARGLERELAYPGQVKVSVIRETRAVTFAV